MPQKVTPEAEGIIDRHHTHTEREREVERKSYLERGSMPKDLENYDMQKKIPL